MFRYTAYGLRIQSSLALPELVEDIGAESDVNIRYGSLGREIPSDSEGITCLQAAAHEVYLAWGKTAILLIQGGQDIIIDPFPGVDERVLRLFILGAGLGVLLHQRGQLVLHASAAAVNGRVVVFIGEKGWGKSTTAAALHARGHQLMTDDLVAITGDSGCPLVLPGYPQVKLWPESVEALGTNPETLPQIRAEIEKRAQSVVDGFVQTPLPLAVIYVLGGGTEFGIDALPPQIALLQMVRHLYVSRFGSAYYQAIGDKSHLAQCADLLQHVPVRWLRRKQDLSALDYLAALIEADAARLDPVPKRD